MMAGRGALDRGAQLFEDLGERRQVEVVVRLGLDSPASASLSIVTVYSFVAGLLNAESP